MEPVDEDHGHSGDKKWPRRVLRGLAGLAVVGGLVLGGLGVQANQQADDDEARADALRAETADLADAGATLEGDQVALVRRTERTRDAADVLQTTAQDLTLAHRALPLVNPGTRPGDVFDRAVDVWNTGDHAGAVAIVDAEIPGLLGEWPPYLRDIEELQQTLRRQERDLPRRIR